MMTTLNGHSALRRDSRLTRQSGLTRQQSALRSHLSLRRHSGLTAHGLAGQAIALSGLRTLRALSGRHWRRGLSALRAVNAGAQLQTRTGLRPLTHLLTRTMLTCAMLTCAMLTCAVQTCAVLARSGRLTRTVLTRIRRQPRPGHALHRERRGGLKARLAHVSGPLLARQWPESASGHAIPRRTATAGDTVLRRDAVLRRVRLARSAQRGHAVLAS
jgi:hypothetical protein